MAYYKRFVANTNVLWAYTRKLFIPLLILLGSSQVYFLYNNFTKASFQNLYDKYYYQADRLIKPWSLRFEEYLARSYVKEIFIIAFIITLIILVSIPLRQKMVSKVEYTYLRMPSSKYTWFFTNVIYYASILFILIAVQLLVIFIGYIMYLHFVPEDAVMTGGLFLAFTRWDFINALYHVSEPLKIVVNFFYLIHLGFIITYFNVLSWFKSKVTFFIFATMFPFLINTYDGIIGFSIVIVLMIIFDIWILYKFNDLLEKTKEGGMGE